MEIPPNALEQEAGHDEWQPSRRISGCRRDRCLLREAVDRLDSEALAVVGSSLTWCVDGVAVTRHVMFVVPFVLVGAIGVDLEFDGYTSGQHCCVESG